MIEKYRSEVLRSYEEKKAAGQLSMNLTHPTTSRLKRECRLLFIHGRNKTDQRVLREFLNLPFNEEIFESTIRKCDPDKFKPLDNFLKKGIKTHEKNVELLARLIDFRPRPFLNYWHQFHGKPSIENMAYCPEETNLPEVPPIFPATVGSKEYSTFVHILPFVPAFYLLAKQIFKRISKGFLMLRYSQHKRNIKKLYDRNAGYDGFQGGQNGQNKVTLEYPSGVKLSVDASDISLIAELVRL